MKKFGLIGGIVVLSLGMNAQAVLNYKGPFKEGFAEYSYVENQKGQRVFQGKFTYSDTLEIGGRGLSYVMITGNYKDDKKLGPWVATIVNEEGNIKETATGPYLEGQKSGYWTHRLTVNDTIVKDITATFNKNVFRAKLSYQYNPNWPVEDYKSLSITGSFDNKGMLDGEWIIDYTDASDHQVKEIMRFQHGVMAFHQKKDVGSGVLLQNTDETEFVTAYFANLQFPDSMAVVDGKKYGIKKAKNEHPLITTVMKVWNETDGATIGNGFKSSLPQMIVERGEFEAANYLVNRQEIIDWLKTPKGKAEFEAAKKKEEEYNGFIAKGDEAFEAKAYEDAIESYRNAMRVKNDPYPISQIQESQKLMRIRDQKAKLQGAIQPLEEEVNKLHEQVLASEDFEKKQKHLYAAYLGAHDYAISKLKKEHEVAIAAMANGDMESVSVDQLEAYQKGLEQMKSFIQKVKRRVGADTKDLEKELKKMEAGGAYYDRLMQ